MKRATRKKGSKRETKREWKQKRDELKWNSQAIFLFPSSSTEKSKEKNINREEFHNSMKNDFYDFMTFTGLVIPTDFRQNYSSTVDLFHIRTQTTEWI